MGRRGDKETGLIRIADCGMRSESIGFEFLGLELWNLLSALSPTLCARRYVLFMAAIGKPATLFHQKTGGIVPWLGRKSMIDRGWDLPFLKNFIFRIPGKNEKRMI
jgi:hypothetical protein